MISRVDVGTPATPCLPAVGNEGSSLPPFGAAVVGGGADGASVWRPSPTQARSPIVVESVARNEVPNTVEVLCRPAADQKARAVVAQEYVLAQEPAACVTPLVEGICGEGTLSVPLIRRTGRPDCADRAGPRRPGRSARPPGRGRGPSTRGRQFRRGGPRVPAERCRACSGRSPVDTAYSKQDAPSAGRSGQG